MSDTWFTSDLHLGHANILEYEKENRPYAHLDEMHEAIISNWNSVVKPNDKVYVLGDFCFGKSYLYLAGRMQGRKILVMGNHDKYDSASYLLYFDKLLGMVYWESCVLSHMPVHTHSLGSRWWVNVHGHLHSKVVGERQPRPDDRVVIIEDRNYFNVSCERHNMTPVHADVIRERVKEVQY